jgi:ferredoxin
MTHQINKDECIACGACESECPEGAIAEAPEGGYYVIDESKCKDCGDCAAVCPVECISKA